MKWLGKYAICGIAFALFLAPASVATATELVWAPINPSFVGGVWYNAQWLMSSAQIQNKHKEPTPVTQKVDPFADFEYNLKRQYIYALSSKIINEAFGEEGLLPEGETEAHYTIGDFRVDITANGALNVVITDNSTGNTTSVEVPYY